MLTLRSTAKTDRLIEWQVGMPTEDLKSAANRNTIDWIQADGNERDYIHEKFGIYIRHARADVLRWFGEEARFLAWNL